MVSSEHMFKLPLTTCLLCVSSIAFSQTLYGTGGFALDANNSGHFKSVPLSAQVLTGRNPRQSFIIMADFGIPLARQGSSMAYSLGENQPPLRVTSKTKAAWANISLGLRAIINSSDPVNQFFVDFLPFSLGNQHWTVKYRKYDAAHYEILDPDYGLNNWGLNVGIGIGWTHERWVLQTHIYSPPASKKPLYDRSYKYTAPFQFMFGYRIFTRKL